ncbi:MAG: hypothetical protein ACR2HJ_09845 [Fimbriimonadales bacterium]
MTNTRATVPSGTMTYQWAYFAVSQVWLLASLIAFPTAVIPFLVIPFLASDVVWIIVLRQMGAGSVAAYGFARFVLALDLVLFIIAPVGDIAIESYMTRIGQTVSNDVDLGRVTLVSFVGLIGLSSFIVAFITIRRPPVEAHFGFRCPKCNAKNDPEWARHERSFKCTKCGHEWGDSAPP